jgi:hypothetical protein
MRRSAAIAHSFTFPLIAQEKSKRPSIYDKNADAIALVDAAQKRAARDGKQVLAMFGGDWCGWCHLLHNTFKRDKAIRKTLRDEYELVMIDTKAKGANELKARWKSPINGYPYLVVIDAKGTVVRNQETAALEKGKKHDPAKVLGFLEKYKAKPLDARDVLASAMAESKRSGRSIFVHLGAPW